MSKSPKFRYEIGFSSHQGFEKEINEDNYCAEYQLNSQGASMGVLAVSDGVGGFSLGEIASKISINQVEDFFQMGEFEEIFTEAEFVEPERIIQELYTRANHMVMTLTEKEKRPVGSTLATGFFYEDCAYVAGVGNSRAYLIRKNAVKKLTDDWIDPLTGVNLGKFRGDKSLKGSPEFVNVLGADVSIKVNVEQFQIEDGDIFLFCTDGLFTQLSDEDIISIKKESTTIQSFCNILVEKANLSGGKDNVTAVALRVSMPKFSVSEFVSNLKKSGKFSPTNIIVAFLIFVLFLVGSGFIIKKIALSGKKRKKRVYVRNSLSPQGYENVYNSLSLASEIPINYIKINNESRKLEGESHVFIFDRDANNIRIVPAYRKMKSYLYTLSLVGRKRNLYVLQSRRNKIILGTDTVTIYLTVGSRVDFKAMQEASGDLFQLKIDNLGSDFTIVMKSEENISVEVKYQKKSSKTSKSRYYRNSKKLIEKPGKRKGEKFYYYLE